MSQDSSGTENALQQFNDQRRLQRQVATLFLMGMLASGLFYWQAFCYVFQAAPDPRLLESMTWTAVLHILFVGLYGFGTVMVKTFRPTRDWWGDAIFFSSVLLVFGLIASVAWIRIDRSAVVKPLSLDLTGLGLIYGVTRLIKDREKLVELLKFLLKILPVGIGK